ncbi:hypothetical protein FPRO05_12224 [Fusarium proliferatum]|uniref:Uncharacterized protein n=1 Tax=Gibberella intermedia TaxID=948311 RepID=A0A365N4A1_GIBIN|nr:hypothetical protein FPRO05_12224 [Fusarium proliferatum]
MTTAGPSEYRLVTDQAESAQNPHTSDSVRLPPPHCKPLMSPSPCESLTGIPQPSLKSSNPSYSYRRYSHTSLAYSSKSSSVPSRSCSPDSSPASSIQEESINDEEIKEPEPDLPKAPEHFERVFSVPKAIFEIYETYREWHFGFAAKQNVHVLMMRLNQANLKLEKAEQEVRALTQRLSSIAEPEPKIQPSKREQNSEVQKATPSRLRKKRDARRRELIENKYNKPLKERFEELAGWSEKVEADIDAAQDRNTFLDDMLHKAGRDIRKLQGEKLSLEANKGELQKQLEQSLQKMISRHDSSTQTEVPKDEAVACQTTMAHDDQTSVTSGDGPVQPLALQVTQDDRLAELQRENDRLRQENEEMRNAIEQRQGQDSSLEGSESRVLEVQPEEAHTGDEDPEAQVQGANVEMGGITTGDDSTASENIEIPVIPVTPPVTSEAEETLVFYPLRYLNNINRDPGTSSDIARHRRDSRRRRRREQRKLERAEEEAQQQQQRRLERDKDARRPRKHHRKSLKVYREKKKIPSPLGWVRYRRTLMDFLSFHYMFSSPLKLS